MPNAIDQRIEDERWMRVALSQAELAQRDGEVPVGAVVVDRGREVAVGYNQPISSHDFSAHAEIVALRQACTLLQNYRLPGITLYVTVEPCTMCVGALVHARVDRLVFGARETKAGAVVSHSLLDRDMFNHSISVTAGILEQQCSSLMSEFFARRRSQHKEEIGKI